MSAKIIVPDPACLIVSHSSGVDVYAPDMQEDYPLYRKIKLIAKEPILLGRRTAHMVWIVHEQRLRRGGDQWKLQQAWPELINWVIPHIASLFDLEYVKDTFGFTDDELTSLIEAERAKYEK